MSLGKFQKQTKYILLAFISIFIFIVTIFLGRSASVYFARASDCPATNFRADNIGPNSAVINWDSDEESQGRVEYGTNTINLTFNAPEASATLRHNVPLTLLTPNTVYYYLIAVGETRCDSTNQKCEEGSCVPYSFTTAAIGETADEAENLPTRAAGGRTNNEETPMPTSNLSLFCKAVQANIGKSSKAAAEWASIKTYDIDGNGIINGLDIIKCQKAGK